MMSRLTSQYSDQTIVLPTPLAENPGRGMETLTVHDLSRQYGRRVPEGKKVHDAEVVMIGIGLIDHSCSMDCPERVTT